MVDALSAARMGGSSIAAPSAGPWITDFLNAAWFARGAQRRSLDDLRLAFTVLTTRWHRLGRRLRAADVAAFHRAFGADRLRRAARLRAPTLTGAGLMDGAERLLGPGFAEGLGDPERSGWGIVFADAAQRDAYVPERRLADAALGALTPPRRPPAAQRWHTYERVPVASADGVMDVLAAVERWPDLATELGRFTPLRSGGLEGQTFEIELLTSASARAPLLTRAYVTATRVLDRRSDPAGLAAYVDALARDMGAAAEVEGERRPLPEDAVPAGVVELTTHAGHPIGRAVSRIVAFEGDDGAFTCDVGSWDPMPAHLAVGYRLAGRRAQVAFWGAGPEAQSMLRQLALRVAGPV
jgi:hypothetical protein